MAERTHYTTVQIALHWLIAILITVNYVVSDGMDDAFDKSLEGVAPGGFVAVVHVYVGLAVLVLAVLRLVVRSFSGVPEMVDGGQTLFDRLGFWSHRMLYALMLLVPALGAITWYGGVHFTADLHVLTMNAMMLLVLIHAAAALFHHYVLNDGLIWRMLRAR